MASMFLKLCIFLHSTLLRANKMHQTKHSKTSQKTSNQIIFMFLIFCTLTVPNVWSLIVIPSAFFLFSQCFFFPEVWYVSHDTVLASITTLWFLSLGFPRHSLLSSILCHANYTNLLSISLRIWSLTYNHQFSCVAPPITPGTLFE